MLSSPVFLCIKFGWLFERAFKKTRGHVSSLTVFHVVQVSNALRTTEGGSFISLQHALFAANINLLPDLLDVVRTNGYTPVSIERRVMRSVPLQGGQVAHANFNIVTMMAQGWAHHFGAQSNLFDGQGWFIEH